MAAGPGRPWLKNGAVSNELSFAFILLVMAEISPVLRRQLRVSDSEVYMPKLGQADSAILHS